MNKILSVFSVLFASSEDIEAWSQIKTVAIRQEILHETVRRGHWCQV